MIDEKALIEIVKFYANSDNYLFNKYGRGLVVPEEDKQSVVNEDMGDLARQALKLLGAE